MCEYVNLKMPCLTFQTQYFQIDFKFQIVNYFLISVVCILPLSFFSCNLRFLRRKNAGMEKTVDNFQGLRLSFLKPNKHKNRKKISKLHTKKALADQRDFTRGF